MAKQDKWNEDQGRRLQGIEQSIEQITTHGRMVDNQIAQLASSSSREHGKLPSKLDPNHRESMNAITLRGGKQLEILPAQSTRPRATAAPYVPPVPFPQRLKATRRDKEFMQFIDKIRTLYITMPFTDAITQIPTYSKFMKEILTGKRKMEGIETVALSEECSAAMHQPMAPKLKDSGSFSIPCDIGDITIRHALCDLGASTPEGILKDVPVKVKNIYIPADFIVLEISEDIDIPIILGRPFIYTAKVVIAMDRGSIALRVGSERVVFYLPDMCKTPSLLADCDVLDSADIDHPITLTSIESYRVIPGCPIPMDICAMSVEGAAAAKAEQNAESGKEPCKVEMKSLHASLRYEFLGPNSTYPVIVNASLNDVETQKLLDVLREHRPALGYSIDDLKGISPDLCMHRINLECNARLSRDALRRLNPKLNEVVKKEILKLLNAGIIYSVADSKWVSPVHVVP
ncbi:unnamed protein product [Rhodiola kirilowii]